MPGRRKKLTDEDKELWSLVAKSATPLDPTRPLTPEADDKSVSIPPKNRKIPSQHPAPLPRFMVGQNAKSTLNHKLAPSIHDELSGRPLSMDHKTHIKMTKGKIKPEARIDLHGMTVAEAHAELRSFILTSQQNGKRLVLVITGKGKDRDDGGPIPTRMGVLRHQAPQWLRLPPLNHVVMQVTPAHLKHGGHGAYYVYLRRLR